MKRKSDITSMPRQETEQMAKRDQCCARCGERFESTRPTVHEVIANSISALLLSAILLPVGWKLNQTAEHFCYRFAQHLLWREPVEDWNRRGNG
jgi:hypothetical protein